MARPGKPKWYPRKNWSDLKPATRKRHERNGITRQSYYTKKGQAKVTASRGHARTPERPERAAKNPEKYTEYIQKRDAVIQAGGPPAASLEQQALARKRKAFADRIGWSRKRGNKMTGATDTTMRKVLSMNTGQIENAASSIGQAVLKNMDTVDIDGVTYDVIDWEWLLYH